MGSAAAQDEYWIAGQGGGGFDRGVLEKMELWIDDGVRDGWENMAVDDWLLETARCPVLRIYGWEDGWGSYGYFVPDSEALLALPGLRRVRRRTGGGIVDHRNDRTFTLVVPSGGRLAHLRGGESYRFIHSALAVALEELGHPVHLASGRTAVRGGECFSQPAEHDLLDATGRKVAGGGQRRSSHGLLHQGSVGLALDPWWGQCLAAAMVRSPGDFTERPVEDEIRCRAKRYQRPVWAKRR